MYGRQEGYQFLLMAPINQSGQLTFLQCTLQFFVMRQTQTELWSGSDLKLRHAKNIRNVRYLVQVPVFLSFFRIRQEKILRYYSDTLLFYIRTFFYKNFDRG